MSVNHVARNEAWITSLLMHVALLAGVIAVVGRPRETAEGPVVIDTRDGGHEIGVVMLTESLERPAPIPAAPLPPISVAVAPPVEPPAPPAPPSTPVQTVEHREPAVRPAATVGGSPSISPTPPAPLAPPPPPVAHGSGSSLPAGTATEFFGVPAVGKSVVFVLDRSASMGLDGRLERARRELAASLRRLPPSARFQVIAYNRTADPVRLPGRFGLLPATPDAVEGVIAAVESLPAEGGTDHAAALTAAVGLGPDVIYFLTDEDDLEMKDVEAVTRRNHDRVCIHALCLVAPTNGETPMMVLARSNRGVFRVVDR
jgi:hypothetical protein